MGVLELTFFKPQAHPPKALGARQKLPVGVAILLQRVYLQRR